MGIFRFFGSNKTPNADDAGTGIDEARREGEPCETCLDQVNFMEALVQPDRLRARILLWAEEQSRLKIIPEKATAVLEAVLYRGELPRGELPALLGVTDRQARRIVSSLIDQGVLSSKTQKAPLRLAFPANLADRLMPGLFPES